MGIGETAPEKKSETWVHMVAQKRKTCWSGQENTAIVAKVTMVIRRWGQSMLGKFGTNIGLYEVAGQWFCERCQIRSYGSGNRAIDAKTERSVLGKA